MADKTYTFKVVAQGLMEAAKGMEQLAAEGAKLEGVQGKVTKSNKKNVQSQHEVTKAYKGTSQSTSGQSKAFSKMAQGMEGTLVPAYAAVAANVFALTAAFGALSRAADLQILINASDELATTTGRNLTTVGKSMKALTGEAISLKEAMTNASLAASAGFDNTTIEKLTTVAKNASVALGRDMTDSLNRIFKGAIKAEPELLDELGIIVRLDKASRDYAATLGKNVKALTTFEKQTAVVNAVLAEGEKKFSAIGDIDVNPYTKLGAAFSDLAINMTNIIAVPIVPVIEFLTDNIASLTAVLILFGASILKTAFPALQKFSETINTKMNAAITSLGAKIEWLNAKKLSLLPKTQVDKTIASGEALKAEFQAIADRYTAMGKNPPKGVINTLNQVTGTAQQATAAMKTLQITGQNIAGGRGSVIGLNASDISRVVGVVSILEKDISKLGTSTQTATAKAATGFAALGIKIVEASISVVTFGSNVIQSTFKSISAVSAQTSAWLALKEAINQTNIAYKTNTGFMSKTFGTAGAAIGGFGAALFKAIPIIGSVIFGLQILGTAFSFFKDLLFDEDIIKLNESLETQSKSLLATAKSTKFYKDSLSTLLPTIDNVNKQLTLQVNVLTDLFSNLEEVVNDVDLSEGFGVWSKFLDYIWLGDFDTFKDSLEKVVLQLNELGYIASVNELIAEYGDVTNLGEDAARAYGNELKELNKTLRDNARAAKDANDQIFTTLENLDKSLSKLNGSLPTLTGLEASFTRLSSLMGQLDNAPMIELVTTMQNLTNVGLQELGLQDLVTDTSGMTVRLEELTKSVKDWEKQIESIQGKTFRFDEDTEAIGDASRNINIAKREMIELEQTLENRADLILEKLELVREEFYRIILAEREFIKASAGIKLDLLNPKFRTHDHILEQIDLESKLYNLEQTRIKDKDARTRKQQANTIAGLAEIEAKLEKNDLASTNAFAKQDQGKVDTLAVKRADLEVEKALALGTQLQLEKALDDQRVSSFNNSIKAMQKLGTQLDTVYNKQIGGQAFWDSEAFTLQESFKEAITSVYKELSILQGKVFNPEDVDEFYAAFQDQAADRLVLSRAGVKSFADPSKETTQIEARIEALESEIDLYEELGIQANTLFNKEQLITQARLDREIDVIQDKVLDTSGAEEELKWRRLLADLEDTRTASIAEGATEQTKGVKILKLRLKEELKSAKDLLALGTNATAQERDSLKIQKKITELGIENETVKKSVLAYEEAIAKVGRNIEFGYRLQEAAEAMNELAEATRDFRDNLEVSKPAAGLILLQETMNKMDGSIAQFGGGMATLGLAIMQYDKIMASNVDTQQKSRALMDLSMNSLGALASAFGEGSAAAKLFTMAQHGVAIANAVVAVTRQGTEADPITAPARVAAMLALMASVLAAFGVNGGGGGSGSSAPSAGDRYKETIGSQGLVGRELVNNTLVDGLDELIGVNTKMFSVTRDLQVTMSELNDTFKTLAGQLLNIYGSASGLSAKVEVTNLETFSISGGIETAIKGVSAVVDTFTLGLGGGIASDFLNDTFGSTRTVTESIIDSGLEFNVAIQSLGDTLTGSLNTLTFAVIQGEDRTTHAFHSDSVTNYIRKQLDPLDEALNFAFELAFDQVLDGVNLLITNLADSAGVVDISALFSSLTGFRGNEALSLEGLTTGEEISDAIGAYFSSLTSDIAGTVLPFLSDFQMAGEELGDTLIRLAVTTIKLNDALAIVGASTTDFASIMIDESEISSQIDSQVATIASDLETFSDRTFSTIGTQLSDTLASFIVNIVAGVAPDAAQIARSVNAAAEAFKIEVLASWNTALLSGSFIDADEFNKTFNVLAEQIFSELELADFSKTGALDNITDGFASLVEQVNAMGRVDLAEILEGGLTTDTLRQFYDLAIATDAFAVSADFATGVIDTSGADLLATVTLLGPAFQQLADAEDILNPLIEAIDTLNDSYVRQIALFGQLDKDNALLNLAFDYQDAIQEAIETGSSLEAVEVLYGLRRLEIVKDYYEQIEDEIVSAMQAVTDSIIDVSSNLDVWDDVAFATIKINKLVESLKKGTTNLNLDSLLGDTTGFEEFIENFSNIIDGISSDAPTSVSDEIALVDQLRQEIISKYELESSLIEGQSDLFKQLSEDINNFLDSLIISDLSPLTNFERLGEATSQFLDNAANVFSSDTTIAENASTNLLDSASSLLDIASLFYAIGPEYVKVFDLVTSTLGGIDTALLDSLNDTDSDPIIGLTEDVLAKLSVLDSILIELEANNEQTYFSDIAYAVTEGMFPLITDVTDKLQQIDDGSWTTMVAHLATISSASVDTLLAINAGALQSVVNESTGEITSYGVGTPYVPEDMVANIHQGEAIVPESMAESIRNGELSLGNVDNTEVVAAIKELTLVLAVSQEDIIEATRLNNKVAVSGYNQPVDTAGVV